MALPSATTRCRVNPMAIRDGNWELDHQLSIIGVRYVWKYWDGTRLHIRTDYPMDGLLKKDNAESVAESQGRRFGDFERVASVPLNVYHDSGLAEAISQADKKFTSRWLNDGDHASFRTSRGRI